MMKSIEQNLNHANPSMLYPFFWQHGESNEMIEDYIEKMKEQKIDHFCVESRTHPDFMKEDWWRTMDCILEQAKARNMTFWILDDVMFPTGSANHNVPEQYKKQYLAMRRLDLKPMARNSQVLMDQFVDGRTMMKDKRHAKDTLFKIFAAEQKNDEPGCFDHTTLVDLTDKVQDGLLDLDCAPGKGISLFIFYHTACGLEDATKDHMDMMNPKAVQCLIHEVYEPHYEHYKEEFGKTIEGFFSDEPRFGNAKGNQSIIGRADMPLPWNDLVEAELTARGFEWQNLVDLFIGEGKAVGLNRALYMNVITDLYSKHFNQQIGNWCREHGVHYIGHVIEDNNAHQRLGYGPGHFFRSEAGQSYAGIDIIGGQVVPGMDYQHTSFATGGADGEFYHYTLLKLGASEAKLDPKKENRLMCEAFGAYGWVEGLKMMKWITDHMIVHGVNWIVPHAFDMAPFPDWDCPPHFYAHGNNPQYPYFHVWSEYAGRLCAMMSHGHSYARIGVLYTADAEWNGNTMQLQSVLKVLENNQISADIISEDYLLASNTTENSFEINGHSYDLLLVPDCDGHSETIEKWLNDNSKLVRTLKKEDLPGLADSLEAYREVKLHTPNAGISFVHQVQEDGDLYLFQNTNLAEAVDTVVTIATDKPFVLYDAMNNTLQAVNGNVHDGVQDVKLHVEPYGLAVFATADAKLPAETKTPAETHAIDAEVKNLKISAKAYNESKFTQLEAVGFTDLSKILPRFSGILRYEFDVDLDDANVAFIIPEVSETVDVTVNGKHVGTKIVPPYQFDLSKAAHAGKNHVQIDVVNTLFRNQRDSFSQFIAMDPLGIQQNIEWLGRD